MTEIDRDAPILVTGATGYLAGVIIRQLLEAGHTVHATVRDPERTEKLARLNAVAAGAPGRIRYFKADLRDADAFAPAMAGCELVIHTASPFITSVETPQRDLVEPAVAGVRNVLAAANSVETVKRVVMTSSCAAIYSDNTDIRSMPAGKLTEAVWNTSASLDHQAYSLSKTLAEKAGWDMAEAQSRWDLVAINPSFILGPGIDPDATGESYSIMIQFGDGTMAPGVPDFGIGVVDVREVADAHIKAGFTPSASGRYIVSGHNSSFPEIAGHLRERFGDAYRFPRKVMPKFLVWLVGPMINKALTRKMVARNVGVPFLADNSRSVQDLGMEYRPLSETVGEFFQHLADAGRVTPRS